jgi:alpha-1,2-glucosyltransferase
MLDSLQLASNVIRAAWASWKGLIVCFWPFFLLAFGFLGFLRGNGGIVLGDRSNHIAVVHLPQIFYFVGFSTAFLLPSISIRVLKSNFLEARRWFSRGG